GVVGVLAAGAFLFYPEDTVLHALMLAVATILWCGLARRLPGPRAFASLASLAVCAFLAASLPFWQSTPGFAIHQLGGATGHVPDTWSTYFDSYWQGLRANAPADLVCQSCVSGIANRILAAGGMFFLTPDYSAGATLRTAWIVATAALAAVTLYNAGAVF